MAAEQRSILLHGVDFTSAPRPKKGITIASGYLQNDSFVLESLSTLHEFSSFIAWLQQPGPWLGGFDFPFSFPRELIELLGWPGEWAALIQHVRQLPRAELRLCFKAICDARPAGSKFIHRDCDLPAKSSSPMKWVNPPVAYMLHAGAPLLLDAGVEIPFMHAGDPSRIALEAYPGLVARAITKASYKSDTPQQQTPERQAARRTIVRALERGDYPQHIRLDAGRFKRQLIDDGSGDLLDAVLCGMMAAWAWQRRDHDFGLPPHDPLEGWILGA
ncbi:MAG: DUF429 domain-containing protein [Burkholderiaceae bacterium]|jgi:Protein of unknown function (DUF429)